MRLWGCVHNTAILCNRGQATRPDSVSPQKGTEGCPGAEWKEALRHERPAASRTPASPAFRLPSQCVYGGVLRGTGKQAFGALANAVMYYVIGLPLGIVLTFVVRMGIMGRCCEGRWGGSREPWAPSPPWLVSLPQASGWACWLVASWQPPPSLSTRPAWTGSLLPRR